MRSSYLDYAMSVIVGRALPDVRDGLKPVHRRVLYAMHEAGPAAEPRRTASARRVVGDVMGNYHPHGDQAIYDTLVRLGAGLRDALPAGRRRRATSARSTTTRRPRCGTPRRAWRGSPRRCCATSTRTPSTSRPNYDESRQEPLVLPARFPNLLVNGSSGIAVGMATNIPPHNLREAIDAVDRLHRRPGDRRRRA